MSNYNSLSFPTLRRWVRKTSGQASSDKLISEWRKYKNERVVSNTDLEQSVVGFTCYLDEKGNKALSNVVSEWLSLLRFTLPQERTTNVLWVN